MLPGSRGFPWLFPFLGASPEEEVQLSVSCPPSKINLSRESSLLSSSTSASTNDRLPVRPLDSLQSRTANTSITNVFDCNIFGITYVLLFSSSSFSHHWVLLHSGAGLPCSPFLACLWSSKTCNTSAFSSVMICIILSRSVCLQTAIAYRTAVLLVDLPGRDPPKSRSLMSWLFLPSAPVSTHYSLNRTPLPPWALAKPCLLLSSSSSWLLSCLVLSCLVSLLCLFIAIPCCRPPPSAPYRRHGRRAHIDSTDNNSRPINSSPAVHLCHLRSILTNRRTAISRTAHQPILTSNGFF